ncbi:phosphate signaling complex protein PhoU [bacterium]|nr:phosphate signaling complex protein PhoU [bacterium]
MEEKLTFLKKEIIEYSVFIDQMIRNTIKGLVNKDKNLLLRVAQEDEKKANDLEIHIEELCTSFIAKYEPRAKDLRTILMILKMNNDMERIGDHCVNIVESALYLIERPDIKDLIDIPKMALMCEEMLKESIDCFIKEDSVLARKVCDKDFAVDELKDKIYIDLVDIMKHDAKTVKRALHLMRISTNLERIADLTTNICEDVIFVVEGAVIKHQGKEKLEDRN